MDVILVIRASARRRGCTCLRDRKRCAIRHSAHLRLQANRHDWRRSSSVGVLCSNLVVRCSYLTLLVHADLFWPTSLPSTSEVNDSLLLLTRHVLSKLTQQVSVSAGPREAPLLRECPENTDLCKPAAPLHDSGWFAEVIQLDIHGEEYLEGGMLMYCYQTGVHACPSAVCTLDFSRLLVYTRTKDFCCSCPPEASTDHQVHATVLQACCWSLQS